LGKEYRLFRSSLCNILRYRMKDKTHLNPNIIQRWRHCGWNSYWNTKEWKDANNCHSANSNHSIFSPIILQKNEDIAKFILWSETLSSLSGF
jgi:hypothetical protein